MMLYQGKDKWLLLIPTYCVVAFVALFISATFYYPGGSQLNHFQSGFSWSDNYLCNLLGKYAVNGHRNEARIIGITAVMILGYGIGFFYYVFSPFFELRWLWRNIVRTFGVFSMIFAVLLFTNYHDLVLNIAGISGAVAISGTLLALERNHSYGLTWLGFFCCIFLILNAYIYYSGVLIHWLPTIQKLAIITLLLWITGMNITYYKLITR